MKRKTRALLLQKYAVILLLLVLNLLYLLLGDWMFGYGLGNIPYILNYLLYTSSEKLGAAILLLCLILPDIKYWITGSYPGRSAEK